MDDDPVGAALEAAERTGVPERAIRDWFEERLITPQRLRSQVLEGPEASGDAGYRVLGELLDAHLVRAETRRQATWYELAHDRLIEPVRRDNAAWRAEPEGDVVMPKIANVKLLAQPTDTGKVLATLARTEELVVIGGVKDGFVNVQSATASGWIKIVLVTKR